MSQTDVTEQLSGGSREVQNLRVITSHPIGCSTTGPAQLLATDHRRYGSHYDGAWFVYYLDFLGVHSSLFTWQFHMTTGTVV